MPGVRDLLEALAGLYGQYGYALVFFGARGFGFTTTAARVFTVTLAATGELTGAGAGSTVGECAVVVVWPAAVSAGGAVGGAATAPTSRTTNPAPVARPPAAREPSRAHPTCPRATVMTPTTRTYKPPMTRPELTPPLSRPSSATATRPAQPSQRDTPPAELDRTGVAWPGNTGKPSSRKNCQPSGAGGHFGSGRQFRGGCQPSGGVGHPGGGLKREDTDILSTFATMSAGPIIRQYGQRH